MFVSVVINTFSAIYNIFSDIFILCCMCGLPGHTYDDSGLILKARVWQKHCLQSAIQKWRWPQRLHWMPLTLPPATQPPTTACTPPEYGWQWVITSGRVCVTFIHEKIFYPLIYPYPSMGNSFFPIPLPMRVTDNPWVIFTHYFKNIC